MEGSLELLRIPSPSGDWECQVDKHTWYEVQRLCLNLLTIYGEGFIVFEVNIAQFKKSSKYYNRKVNAPEGVFDSKKEYKYFLHLKWLESQGKIKNLRRQVVFELVPKTDKFGPVRYKADFVFEDNKIAYDYLHADMKKIESKYLGMKNGKPSSRGG